MNRYIYCIKALFAVGITFGAGPATRLLRQPGAHIVRHCDPGSQGSNAPSKRRRSAGSLGPLRPAARPQAGTRASHALPEPHQRSRMASNNGIINYLARFVDVEFMALLSRLGLSRYPAQRVNEAPARSDRLASSVWWAARVPRRVSARLVW